MTQAQHTPGPWSASLAYGGGSAIWISPRVGPKMVLQGAQCLRSDSVQYEQINVDQLQANATLIAAAPELLDQLKKLRRAYVSLLESGRDRIINLGGTCDPVDVMEANDPNLRDVAQIISKATGSAA